MPRLQHAAFDGTRLGPARDIAAHGVGERLGQFDDRPVLICWGARDFVFDDHFLRVWQRKLPHAEVHRFADAGHYVLEDAGEEIEALVRGFLHVEEAAA